MCASKVVAGGERGWIIPIGGAEEKENLPQVLRRFVQLAGGRSADIVIIPTASQLRDTGQRYERIFNELGAERVSSLDFDTRRDAEEPGRLARLQQESAKALALPAVKERLLSQGAIPGGNTSAEFARFIDAETRKWAQVVKASGAKVD